MALEPYYDHGGITIYLADCRDVLPALGPVDAVVTDPPYGIPHKFGVNVRPHRKGKRTMQFAWDSVELTDCVLDVCRASSRMGMAHVWFCGLHQVSYIADVLMAAGMTPKPAVWVKPYPPPAGCGNWWPSGCEFAVYAYRSGAYFGETTANRSNVWVSDTYRHGVPGSVDHPTQKPLRLISRLVSAVSDSGHVILDPFMGSGTTLVAAKLMGRKAIGIEREERYCDIAVRRLAQECMTFDDAEALQTLGEED